MRLVDSDDVDALSRLVGAVCAELRGARLGGPADDGGDGLRPLRARVCETLLVRFGLLRMKGVDVA